jgi:hypothetical protein
MKKKGRNLLFKAQGALNKVMVVMLCTVLVGLCLFVVSCEKLEIDKQGIDTTKTPELLNESCEFENPLTDLPWLKEIVDELEKDAEAGYKQHARIYQCCYKEGIGFLFELCVDCPDFGYWLKNCEGESLCVMWGHAGDPGTEFGVDFENKELIWEINN